MKVRKFYPRAVLTRLHGRDAKTFNAGEKAAMHFLLRRSRKMGFTVVVVDGVMRLVAPTDVDSVSKITADQAAMLLANVSTKIILRDAA